MSTSSSHFPGPVFLLFLAGPYKREFLRDRLTHRQTESVWLNLNLIFPFSWSCFPAVLNMTRQKGIHKRQTDRQTQRVWINLNLIFQCSWSCFPAVLNMTRQEVFLRYRQTDTECISSRPIFLSLFSCCPYHDKLCIIRDRQTEHLDKSVSDRVPFFPPLF